MQSLKSIELASLITRTERVIKLQTNILTFWYQIKELAPMMLKPKSWWSYGCYKNHFRIHVMEMLILIISLHMRNMFTSFMEGFPKTGSRDLLLYATHGRGTHPSKLHPFVSAHAASHVVPLQLAGATPVLVLSVCWCCPCVGVVRVLLSVCWCWLLFATCYM